MSIDNTYIGPSKSIHMTYIGLFGALRLGPRIGTETLFLHNGGS